MNWCILIPLLVGAICGLLGYLLGKLLGGGNHDNDRTLRLEADLEACRSARTRLESDLESTTTKFSDLETNFNSLQATSSSSNDAEWQAKIAKLEADLNASNSKYANLEAEYNTAQAKFNELASAATAAVYAFDADAAKAAFGKKIKENDLTIVEGIGPKIQELFHNHDVKTWKALSECSVDKCQDVLNSGGERFKIHKPGTWPKQAQMAYEGKWKELFDWQEELDGGV